MNYGFLKNKEDSVMGYNARNRMSAGEDYEGIGYDVDDEYYDEFLSSYDS